MTNVISCETIAIHTITNIMLWSFAAMVIGTTPYSGNQALWNSQRNMDGQTQGTGNTPIWLFTPPAAFGQSSYGSPSASPSFPPVLTANTPTAAPTLHVNVDLGGNALREAANVSFGIASVIGAAILLMRAATNTVINHPRTKKSSAAIAYFETTLLVLAWSFTLVGMVSCGLGYEPKTGWAVFSMAIFAIIGYAVCYAFQVQEDNEKALALLGEGEAADPTSLQHLPPCC